MVKLKIIIIIEIIKIEQKQNFRDSEKQKLTFEKRGLKLLLHFDHIFLY